MCVNAVSPETLFRKYAEAGFLYEQKYRRLRPFRDHILENLRKGFQGGERIHWVLTHEDPDVGSWASVSLWRSTHTGLHSQHLVSLGGPIGSRRVMLAAQAAEIQKSESQSIQNWFSPTNRFPRKVFGSITESLGPQLSGVTELCYVLVPTSSCSWRSDTVRVRRCTSNDAADLFTFVRTHRGEVAALADDLDNSDIELDAVDEMYRNCDLRRFRRVWMAFVRGRDAPIATAVCYRGPLGFNFSFLENRCDLILAPFLSPEVASDATRMLMNSIAPLYADFPPGYIPVITDHGGVAPLLQMGGDFVKLYSRSVWLREGYEQWYRHVEQFYRRIERVLDRRSERRLTATA